MNTFNIGDAAVYLSHGVCRIVAIEEREFTLGKKDTFYIVEIADTRAPKKVFVPKDKASQLLRKTISRADGERIVAYLKDGKAEIYSQTWNRRYREYMELIHTGDAMSVARVLVSLMELRSQQDLSFGERTLLQQAVHMIQTELELVGLSIPERA